MLGEFALGDPGTLFEIGQVGCGDQSVEVYSARIVLCQDDGMIGGHGLDDLRIGGGGLI